MEGGVHAEKAIYISTVYDNNSFFSMMLADVQEFIWKGWIFSGDLRCTVDDWYFAELAQEAWVHTLHRSPEMMKAALVCKSWNQAHRDYLKVVLAAVDAKLRQTAMSNGLAMCGLGRYEVDHVGDVPQYTEEMHIVLIQKGDWEVNVLNLCLVRWKPDDSDVHTLAVHYGARSLDACPYRGEQTEDKPFYVSDATRLTLIPQVCFEDENELGEEQRRELEKWKQDFREQTALWMPTQRDAEDQVDAIEVWRTFSSWHAAWLEGRKGQEGLLPPQRVNEEAAYVGDQ